MEGTERFRIVSASLNLPKAGFQTLKFSQAEEENSAVTVIIGRNGSGKSTLLREFCDIFQRSRKNKYKSIKSSDTKNNLYIYNINTYVNDVDHRISFINLESFTNEIGKSSVDLGELPRRIIALSFTPFDRFSMRDDLFRRFEFRRIDLKEVEYVYLGFKSNSGIYSPSRRLLNSIDDIFFSDSSEESNDRIIKTFTSIGYEPIITLKYRVSRSLPSIKERFNRNGSKEKIESLLKIYPPEFLRDYEEHQGFKYVIDLLDNKRDENSHISFEDLRELAKLRIISIDSVTLVKSDDMIEIELLELSSGELNLLSGFLGLAAYLQEGCLILIDEPENSLHPEWQLRYLEMLDAIIKQYSGCHYIIATHSPLIVSGAADWGATILRLDHNPASIDAQFLADESPDATLVNAFDVITRGNSYVRQIVLEFMTLIKSGESSGERGRELASTLAHVYNLIDYEDPIRPVIKSIVNSTSSKQLG